MKFVFDVFEDHTCDDDTAEYPWEAIYFNKESDNLTEEERKICSYNGTTTPPIFPKNENMNSKNNSDQTKSKVFIHSIFYGKQTKRIGFFFSIVWPDLHLSDRNDTMCITPPILPQ